MAAPPPTSTSWPAYDQVALAIPAAERAVGLPRQLIRARAYWGDYDLHYAGDGAGKALIRAAVLFPWAQAWKDHWALHEDGGQRWVERFMFSLMETPPPVYSFISCTLSDAADRTGVSERTLRRAIELGDLTPHYFGEKHSRILLRAQDLDAWVQSLPTVRYGYRS